MVITYLGNPTFKLSVVSSEITNFIADIVSYSGIEITASKNCTDTPIVKEYNTTDILLDTSNFYIVGGVLYIRPQLFGTILFEDGVYKIEIRFKKPAGHIIITNCIFVDISFKCKVATLLKALLEESGNTNRTKGIEKTSTAIHLLHYSLTNGSNCGCNCFELCAVFNELCILLSGIDLQITNDCGC